METAYPLEQFRLQLAASMSVDRGVPALRLQLGAEVAPGKLPQVFRVMLADADEGKFLQWESPQILGVDIAELFAEAELLQCPALFNHLAMVWRRTGRVVTALPVVVMREQPRHRLAHPSDEGEFAVGIEQQVFQRQEMPVYAVDARQPLRSNIQRGSQRPPAARGSRFADPLVVVVATESTAKVIRQRRPEAGASGFRQVH